MPSGVPGVPDMQLQLGRGRPLCYAAIANTTCELLFRLVSLRSSPLPDLVDAVWFVCYVPFAPTNETLVLIIQPRACFFFLLLLPPETCPNLRPLLFSFYSVAENSNTSLEVAPFSRHPHRRPAFLSCMAAIHQAWVS